VAENINSNAVTKSNAALKKVAFELSDEINEKNKFKNENIMNRRPQLQG
jgi:hypothetical protein